MQLFARTWAITAGGIATARGAAEFEIARGAEIGQTLVGVDLNQEHAPFVGAGLEQIAETFIKSVKIDIDRGACGWRGQAKATSHGGLSIAPKDQFKSLVVRGR